MRGSDGKVTYKQRSAVAASGEDDADVSQKMLNIQVRAESSEAGWFKRAMLKIHVRDQKIG